VTNIYGYTALLLVILTFGMETTFFRFANKKEEKASTVYGTTLAAVGIVALAFVAAVLCFLPAVSQWMGYADHPSYVGVMAVVVGLDAFQAIPFAYLRYQHRPIKFACLKLAFIFLNIGLNLLYFVVFPAMYQSNPTGWVSKIYSPEVGVGYVFYLNLVCTALITFGFYKELVRAPKGFDGALLKRMLSYSWPILVLGIAGILNQTADKILFPHFYHQADMREQLGIYGACVKIAMIMALITQAFRYAYEPFVFGKSEEKDNRETYAKAMKFFIIFTLLAFIIVVAWMDVLKYLIGSDYWAGLKVVPIVMAAEIMMGIYFNLSFWYKLIDKTIWGAWFSGIGCVVLIAVNYFFVPRFGYMACAWGGVAGYGVAMLLSYFVGQRYYRIDYPLRDIAIYTLVAAAMYALMTLLPLPAAWMRVTFGTLLALGFLALIVRREHLTDMFARVLKKIKR